MEKLHHIGVILDGNRRFAKRLMKQPWKGHEWGGKKVTEFLGWCKETDIRTATLYSLSVQNFSRPKIEFEFLMKTFEKEFLEIANNKTHEAHKNKVNVRAVGRLWMLPESVQEAIKKAEQATANYSDFHLNVAIAYGGQEEIVDAMTKIGEGIKTGKLQPSDIDEKLIKENLYTGQPSPDLILRTGGEKRLSNFMTWQSAYSELAFTDKLWPELQKKDFFNIVKDFQMRERRFGR
jgi:tritrans,polycis-undecaprenyl-diphosphate synthase [geranylgeranyl-diphosphate specific]